jgi:hypothetical protein
MGVQGVVTTYVSMTRAQVQTAAATRLLRTAKETGATQPVVELVRQAADTAARILDASVAIAAGGIDVYG